MMLSLEKRTGEIGGGRTIHRTFLCTSKQKWSEGRKRAELMSKVKLDATQCSGILGNFDL